MKNRPTKDTTANARNLSTVVTTCTAAIFDTPFRLINAGTHRPTNAIAIKAPFASGGCCPPWVSRYSTYSTQPVTIAALPAHAVIQYDHALKNPIRLPNATREYAYGPPSEGRRRDSPANSSANANAPAVTSTIDSNVIGPYADKDPGKLKIPTPMMFPTISAVACRRPNRPPRRASGSDAAVGSTFEDISGLGSARTEVVMILIVDRHHQRRK